MAVFVYCALGSLSYFYLWVDICLKTGKLLYDFISLFLALIPISVSSKYMHVRILYLFHRQLNNCFLKSVVYVAVPQVGFLFCFLPDL